jgi:RNA polymerase-binding transcription factor DksA
MDDMAKDPAEQQRTEHGTAFVEAARQRIERERQTAIDRLRELGVSAEADEHAPRAAADVTLDKGDEAQASERNDMNVMARQRLAERVNRLTAALERIAQGQYGRCAICGGPIEAARLAALPEAGTCLACQERREHDAAA